MKPFLPESAARSRKLRRDPGPLRRDDGLDLVFAPPGLYAGNVAQPFVRGFEPIGQRRFDLGHAIFLLKARGEIGQDEAHRYGRRSLPRLGEPFERAPAHDEIDLEAERLKQRAEHVRPQVLAARHEVRGGHHHCRT